MSRRVHATEGTEVDHGAVGGAQFLLVGLFQFGHGVDEAFVSFLQLLAGRTHLHVFFANIVK